MGSKAGEFCWGQVLTINKVILPSGKIFLLNVET